MESLKSLKGKKIKILSSADSNYLESLVNCFCEVHSVLDIKYSVSEGLHYAMIIYKD
jgi:hypothetical protein